VFKIISNRPKFPEDNAVLRVILGKGFDGSRGNLGECYVYRNKKYLNATNVYIKPAESAPNTPKMWGIKFGKVGRKFVTVDGKVRLLDRSTNAKRQGRWRYGRWLGAVAVD